MTDSVMPPLWERLLVAGFGPVITLVFGSIVVAYIFKRWEHRRDDAVRVKERAHAKELARAEERRQISFRTSLVAEITQAGAKLEMALRMYEGELRRTQEDVARVEKLRDRLDDAYRKSRVAGAVLERRLQNHFEDDRAARAWHKAEDFLTVLYYRRIGLASPELLKANAGPKHTGLSVEELSGASEQSLHEEYRTAMSDATRAVLEGGVKLPAW
jgi:hypothetical protein